MQNFFHAITASTQDVALFVSSVLANKLFTGFAVGMLVSVLLTGFIITKDPRRIPLILRYSSMESFQKIAPRRNNGVYDMAFIRFLKMYTQVRTLFLMAFVAFCVMVTTVVLTYKP